MDPEIQELAKFINGSQDPDDRVFVDRLMNNPDALKMAFWENHFEHLSINRYPCINGNILDFGCGSGHADIWLAKRGYKIHGGDSSMAGIQIARHLASKEIIDVSSKLKFDLMSIMLGDPNLKHTFDSVWASNVFEHIIDARSALQAIAVLTKPDAYILISVPQGHCYDDPDHVRHFETTMDLYWHFKTMLRILSIEHDQENHMLRLLGTIPEQHEAPKGTIKERKNFLINPRSMIQEGYAPPPLGLLHIAGMDNNTVIVDLAVNSNADIATVFKQHIPKIVGVPIYTLGRKESINILKLAKERGSITVAGGPHTSVMYKQMEEAYPFIDHLVVGDGELAWEAITQGETLPRVIKMPVKKLSDMNFPAWHLVDINSYQAWGEGFHRGNDLTKLPRCPIIFGRGCPGSCSFCSSWSINGKHRTYNSKWMKCLLDDLWGRGVRHLGWQDDCLTADINAMYFLCDLLSQYQFSSFGTTRVDCMNTELASAMANAGFYELSFGIESGSKTILDKMNKNTNLEMAFSAREALRHANIKFTALMVDNYMGETDITRLETQEFLFKLQPDKICSLGCTLIFPGTQLYQECKATGLINDDFWLGEDKIFKN